MIATRGKAEPDLTSAWGRCAACRNPGLAYSWQFNLQAARCGFCGAALLRTDDDLTDLAARVIAEPVRSRTNWPTLRT